MTTLMTILLILIIQNESRLKINVKVPTFPHGDENDKVRSYRVRCTCLFFFTHLLSIYC